MSDIQKKLHTYKQQMLNELLALKDIEYLELNQAQEAKILESLLNMPADRQNLLMFKNYYQHSFAELKDILDIENPEGEYLYLNSILAEILELDGKFIAEKSIVKVSKMLAEKVNQVSHYELKLEIESNKRAKQHARFGRFFSNKVASFAICFIVLVSALFGANAFADGKIFEWLVSPFEKYSTFTIDEENEVDKNDFTIEINYIPDGFEYKDGMKSESLDTYYYTNGDDVLVIDLVYKKINSNMNTEGATIEDIEIDGVKAIYWQKDDTYFIVTSKNGVGCQIFGDPGKDELIEVYRGLSIERKKSEKK